MPSLSMQMKLAREKGLVGFGKREMVQIEKSVLKAQGQGRVCFLGRVESQKGKAVINHRIGMGHRLGSYHI